MQSQSDIKQNSNANTNLNYNKWDNKEFCKKNLNQLLEEMDEIKKRINLYNISIDQVNESKSEMFNKISQSESEERSEMQVKLEYFDQQLYGYELELSSIKGLYNRMKIISVRLLYENNPECRYEVTRTSINSSAVLSSSFKWVFSNDPKLSNFQHNTLLAGNTVL